MIQKDTFVGALLFSVGMSMKVLVYLLLFTWQIVLHHQANEKIRNWHDAR
jgi:hypothetical protein